MRGQPPRCIIRISNKRKERSPMKSRILAATLAAALPLPGLAQTQQIKPPIATYWLNVETAGRLRRDEVELHPFAALHPGRHHAGHAGWHFHAHAARDARRQTDE